MFVADYSHSEWFRASERLTALIEAVAAGVPLEDLLDRSVAKANFCNPGVRSNLEWRLWRSYASRVMWAFRKLRTDEAYYSEPDRAAEILARWRNYGEADVKPPTAEEIGYLDTVLANPAAYADETLLGNARKRGRAA
jgi:hypothetical protein